MKFGRTVRRLREELDMSIAEFARRVGISPTYLAPIEREVFPPPAEEKIVKIARALGQDPDEFLALAGRVATDLQGIIRKNPSETAKLRRAVKNLPAGDIRRIASSAEKRNGRTTRSRSGSRRKASRRRR